MNPFWQTFKEAEKNTTKSPSFFREAKLVKKLNQLIKIPSFYLDGLVWEGSSYISLEISFALKEKFSFVVPITKPTDTCNFCLAIRSGNPLKRYKLWKEVGEILDYPLYRGEVIEKDFVLEVWSNIDDTVTSLASDYYLTTTILENTEIINQIGSRIESSLMNVNLFKPLPVALPLVLNQPLS